MQQANLDDHHLRTGVMTINELRQQYDLPAIENGDEPFASANLMTLKALIAKSEDTAQPEPSVVPAMPPAEETSTTAEEGEEL